jgi:hypothetical protein
MQVFCVASKGVSMHAWVVLKGNVNFAEGYTEAYTRACWSCIRDDMAPFQV